MTPFAPAVRRLHELSADQLAPLVAESRRLGYQFLTRLVDEWARGANRFDRPGEVLLGAFRRGGLVGVGGLNVDPYATVGRGGRVRHLYVLAAHRRTGVGRALVTELLSAARGVFDRLRLRAADAGAARWYERLGFCRCSGEPHCTHAIEVATGLLERNGILLDVFFHD
jgi:GNAT superfamily N-acetyltransferase